MTVKKSSRFEKLRNFYISEAQYARDAGNFVVRDQNDCDGHDKVFTDCLGGQFRLSRTDIGIKGSEDGGFFVASWDRAKRVESDSDSFT